MSFAAQYAGKQEAVIERIKAVGDGDSFAYGQKLGALTKEYLANVVALIDPERTLVVTSSGHSDKNTMSLDVKIMTIHGM
jgi:hypothetical protein